MATLQNPKRVSATQILLPLGILLILITTALAVIKWTLSSSPSSHESLKIEADAVLPDFKLTSMDGKTSPLSSYKGKVFLINFWATWCEACIEEMPSIVNLRESYKERGFEALGINLDETPEVIAPKTAKKLKMTFPIFKDPENNVANLFDVRAIPLTVIVNQARKILLVKDGEQNWNAPEIRSQVEKWIME